MARKLAEADIQQRLVEGRNYKRLYFELKSKYATVVAENKQLAATVQAQAALIAELQAEVASLREQVSCLTDSKTRYRFYLFGGPGRSGDSGTPRPPDRGAASYVRPYPTEDEITDHQELTLQTCPQCQGPVSASVDSFTECVEDIVFAPKQVTEYTVHRHWCRNCQRIVRPPIPNCLPGMRLGLNTVLFVLCEHYRSRKADEQIVESLDRYFNLHISLGEVSEIRHVAARYFSDKYDAIVQTIRDAEVIYADESGWHIQGVKPHAQVWHVSAPEVPAVLYHIAETRGKDEIQDLLATKDGRQFHGVIVSDFYTAYDGLSAEAQKCWAHVLRDSHFLTASQPDNLERAALHAGLKAVFAAILAFHAAGWDKARAGPLEQQLDGQLRQLAERDWQDQACRRLAKRLAKYRRELLTCVRMPGVEPHNNRAERGLRPVVVHRKVSGGSRSRKGADTFSTNMSVMETLRLEGGDWLSRLRELLWAAAWQRKVGVGASRG